jgi:predicted amidohydrolase YtcJ
VAGGRIDAGPDGSATGVLRESACDLVTGHIKEPDVAVQQRYLADGLRECLEAGLTSVQTNDAGSLAAYQALDARGELPLRVHLTLQADELQAPFRSESGMLCVERVKLFVDGALGADTALLREKDGSVHGIRIHPQEELDAMVARTHRAGLRVEAHAIGDAAAAAALTSFERAGLARADRPVLTHCQVLGADLIERMARTGVIANVQPTFVPTDAAWVRQRIAPDVLPFSYAWKSLINAGVQVAGGSDCPVETCHPLQGIFDAVYRPARHVTEPPTASADVFLPEQRLSFPQALAIYTLGAQFAACRETVRGSIAVGFDCDLTVLDRDVALDPAQLTKASVSKVVVGARLRYDKKTAQPSAKPPARNNGPYASGKGGDPLQRCRCPHIHLA